MNHPFFHSIDFEQLEALQIPPVFVPSTDKTNFDATYDLEELLLEESPLEARMKHQKPRPALKIDATPRERRTEELHKMIEQYFEPFDYTAATFEDSNVFDRKVDIPNVDLGRPEAGSQRTSRRLSHSSTTSPTDALSKRQSGRIDDLNTQRPLSIATTVSEAQVNPLLAGAADAGRPPLATQGSVSTMRSKYSVQDSPSAPSNRPQLSTATSSTTLADSAAQVDTQLQPSSTSASASTSGAAADALPSRHIRPHTGPRSKSISTAHLHLRHEAARHADPASSSPSQNAASSTTSTSQSQTYRKPPRQVLSADHAATHSSMSMHSLSALGKSSTSSSAAQNTNLNTSSSGTAAGGGKGGEKGGKEGGEKKGFLGLLGKKGGGMGGGAMGGGGMAGGGRPGGQPGQPGYSLTFRPLGAMLGMGGGGRFGGSRPSGARPSGGFRMVPLGQVLRGY